MKNIDEKIGTTCRACGEGLLEKQCAVRVIHFDNSEVEVPDDYLQCNECGCMPSFGINVKDYLANTPQARAE